MSRANSSISGSILVTGGAGFIDSHLEGLITVRDWHDATVH